MIKQRNIEIHEVKFFEFVDHVDHVDHELPFHQLMDKVSSKIYSYKENVFHCQKRKFKCLPIFLLKFVNVQCK
jgi:hypothetical protein